MKKLTLLTISTFTFSIVFSQIEKEPILGDLIDLSIEGEKLIPWRLRFEIMEVYKGEKYDNTVITELYFDGIDVH